MTRPFSALLENESLFQKNTRFCVYMFRACLAVGFAKAGIPW